MVEDWWCTRHDSYALHNMTGGAPEMTGGAFQRTGGALDKGWRYNIKAQTCPPFGACRRTYCGVINTLSALPNHQTFVYAELQPKSRQFVPEQVHGFRHHLDFAAQDSIVEVPMLKGETQLFLSKHQTMQSD